MYADPYAESDMLGEDVVIKEERPERTEDVKDQLFMRRKPFRKNPQIGLDIVALTEKLILPVEEFPRYNFVGKLLGPKGSNLKRMQADCKVRMSIMGRGSSKDRSKEEELIEGGDPQYEHLKEPLHVLVSARGNLIEAHRRLGAACRELNKFMGPVNEEMFLMQLQLPDSKPDHMSGREAAMQLQAHGGPKIVFGVPPPGAIILNDNPQFAQARLPSRGDDRSPPPRERNNYRGYGESSDRGGASRYVEKREAGGNSAYPLKRYRSDSYGSTSYTR